MIRDFFSIIIILTIVLRCNVCSVLLFFSQDWLSAYLDTPFLSLTSPFSRPLFPSPSLSHLLLFLPSHSLSLSLRPLSLSLRLISIFVSHPLPLLLCPSPFLALSLPFPASPSPLSPKFPVLYRPCFLRPPRLRKS